ncbi:hypothetical protein AX16_000689 [Volvariella volvacea WC 439]|nr:hypothetical protein AX16_000689 [Volvariella volvacea WC 439]
MADVLHTPKLPSAPIPKYTQGTTPTASSGSTTQVGQTTQRRGQAPPQQRVPAEVQVLSRQMTQPLMQQREPTRDPRKKPQQLPPASALPRPTTQQEESPRPLRTAPAPAQSPSNSTTRAPQTPLRPQSQPQPRVSVAQTPERQTGFILGLGTSPQDAQNFDSEAHLHAELDSLITLMTPDRTNPVKRSSLDEGRSGAGSTGSGTPAKAAQAARPLGAGGRTAPVERGSVGGSSGSAHKATSFGAPQGGGSKRPRESSEEINGWLMKELKLKGFSEEEARAEVQRLQRLNRPAEQPQRSSQVTPAPGQANTDPTPRETANRPSPNSSTLHRQSSNQGGGSSRSGVSDHFVDPRMRPDSNSGIDLEGDDLVKEEEEELEELALTTALLLPEHSSEFLLSPAVAFESPSSSLSSLSSLSSHSPALGNNLTPRPHSPLSPLSPLSSLSVLSSSSGSESDHSSSLLMGRLPEDRESEDESKPKSQTPRPAARPGGKRMVFDGVVIIVKRNLWSACYLS